MEFNHNLTDTSKLKHDITLLTTSSNTSTRTLNNHAPFTHIFILTMYLVFQFTMYSCIINLIENLLIDKCVSPRLYCPSSSFQSMQRCNLILFQITLGVGREGVRAKTCTYASVFMVIPRLKMLLRSLSNCFKYYVCMKVSVKVRGEIGIGIMHANSHAHTYTYMHLIHSYTTGYKYDFQCLILFNLHFRFFIIIVFNLSEERNIPTSLKGICESNITEYF